MQDEVPRQLDADHHGVVDAVCAALNSGSAVVLPTDTVYGLAAKPNSDSATGQLFDLKGRGHDHPLAVLVADTDQALALVEEPSDQALAWMAEHWPGPLTLVMNRSAVARALPLGGDPSTIGIRCPDHDLIRAVASEVGPIATTSANRHGEPSPTTASAAAAALLGVVELVVDGGTSGTVASTVVDTTVDPPEILRQGAVEL